MINKQIYDLVIVGAGPVGMAMAYYTLTQSKKKDKPKKVCIIDNYNKRGWTSDFSAQQHRVQSDQKYMTQFLRQSNKEWDRLQKEHKLEGKLKLVEGSLWIGNTNVETTEGNIYIANKVAQEADVSRLYIKNINKKQPTFITGFTEEISGEWNDWSALYQDDGGSINMNQAYNLFKTISLEHGLELMENTQIKQYTALKNSSYQFKIQKNKVQKYINTTHIFIAAGINTPLFLKQIIKQGGHLMEQGTIHRQTTSYFQIENQDYQKFYSNQFVTFSNFFYDQVYHYSKSVSGFPYHEWDEPIKQKKTVKLSLLAEPQSYLISSDIQKIEGENFDLANQLTFELTQYVKKRMNGLRYESIKSYKTPIITYDSRFTILDYLNRKRDKIVVQTGGLVDGFFPLLAKTAFQMLFNREKKKQLQRTVQETWPNNVIHRFLQRTRFPIRKLVLDYLSNIKPLQNDFKVQFDTLIVGAGSSGLYSAYRLRNNQKTKKLKIGIFQQLDRISGRLLSVRFTGAITPIQLGGMRYIQQEHKMVKYFIDKFQIPSLDFKMAGNPLQSNQLRAFLRNDLYKQNQWKQRQFSGTKLITAYRINTTDIIGMNAAQMIAYSIYQILISPQNRQYVIDILQNDKVFQNIIYRQDQRIPPLSPDPNNPPNPYNYNIKLNLQEWGKIKYFLLFRDPRSNQENNVQPLYKLGFKYVIETLFDHQALTFITQQSGYTSFGENVSYIEQVITFVLDFGNVIYRTLAGGFDMFNFNLANNILDPQTGQQNNEIGIYLNHTLQNIQKGKNNYKVIFKKKQAINLKLIKQPNKIFTFEYVHQRKNRGLIISKIKQLYHGRPVRIRSLNQNINILTTVNKVIDQGFKYFVDLDNENNIKLQEKLDYIIQFQQLVMVKAKRIILAMPRRSVELLANKIQLLQKPISTYNAHRTIPDAVSQDKKQIFLKDPSIIPYDIYELINSTQSQPAIKIIMNFEKSWWDPARIFSQNIKSNTEMRGVSVTDLPIRQNLYFSNGSDNLLLASYSDMINSTYWEPLHQNFKQQYKYQKPLKTIKVEQYDNIYNAKTAMVKEVVRQLELLHNKKIDYKTVKQALYQNWGRDPFGGGFHMWFSGYDIGMIMRCIRKPWNDQNIHIVGEAFSNLTGWVQGALMTAQRLMIQEYNLDPLIPNLYFGQ